MDKIACHTCGKTFEEWGGLATHIMSMRDKPHKRDRSGRMWAAKFHHRNLLRRREFGEITPLTDEQREAKEDTRRELSGQTKLVPVKCPRCKTGSRQFLETEHAENPQAWRIDSCFVVMCERCK